MVRAAAISDIDSLIELRIRLLNETNKNIESYDWYKYSQALKDFLYNGLLNGKAVAFLAEEEGKVVAMSLMCFYTIVPLLYNISGRMALLTDMYTVPEYRNKGMGTVLLNKIMERAKGAGCTKVILNATDSGRKLYEKFGFKDVSGEMQYKFN